MPGVALTQEKTHACPTPSPCVFPVIQMTVVREKLDYCPFLKMWNTFKLECTGVST